jgi:hypothetical protein
MAELNDQIVNAYLQLLNHLSVGEKRELIYLSFLRPLAGVNERKRHVSQIVWSLAV